MAIEFLIGPAGSGKTQACLAQVREALEAAPEGPPLIWIAPKQATFQLEREVLGLGVRGFTRLEILPFDRVARRVLDEMGQPVRGLLTEEGRVMVLHAILIAKAPELTVFRRSARSASGFAAQLSQVLRELQRSGVGVERLRRQRLPEDSEGTLGLKLRDLALLFESYRDWLDGHGLRDPDDLLGLATGALAQARKSGGVRTGFGGVWLDGFAEMTVPELDLLAELVAVSPRATLAFCLDRVPMEGGTLDPDRPGDSAMASSLWSVTATTYARCRERVRGLDLPVQVRGLPEGGGKSPRFRHSAVLDRLAAAWAQPAGGSVGGGGDVNEGINLVECVDPEAEALLAVRLIHRHVRENGGRYREISVIVRRMEGYGDIVQRAFRRHGIPCFADHREPMSHHPVAELTRSVLRMAAGGWMHADWIGALKSGLVVDNPDLVDRIENAGLAHGLRGSEWMAVEEYRARAEIGPDAVRAIVGAVGAFESFRGAMRDGELTGAGLASALRELWGDLGVAETLARWQSGAEDLPPVYRAIHHTAWEQILAWCDAIELAFGETPLPVRDWLAVAEAGLARLTMGVIPPALDQVLLGAIDRARQPEVKLTILLGLNQGVFPAGPPAPALLNWVERLVLAEGGLDLGWARLQLAARESYYAYIACTRASHRLCAAWSRRGLDGKIQARSSVAERLLTFAGLHPDQPSVPGDAMAFDGQLKEFSGEAPPGEAVSISELMECPGWDRWVEFGEAAGAQMDFAAGHEAGAGGQNAEGGGQSAECGGQNVEGGGRSGGAGGEGGGSGEASTASRPCMVPLNRREHSTFNAQRSTGNHQPSTSRPSTGSWEGVPESVRLAAAAAAGIRGELNPKGGEDGRRLGGEARWRLHPEGEVVTSVSALEDFAECPFRHFAGRVLRLGEREEFRADAAGVGTLLHAIMKVFHERAVAERGKWRAWTPPEAAQLVADLGEEQLHESQFAALVQDPLVAWETRRRIGGLAALVGQTIAWMSAYGFDPAVSEYAFGDGSEGAAAAWTLDLGAGRVLKLRGRIDRIDAFRDGDGRVVVAVLDYKLSAQAPSAVEIEHGLDLQSLGYLAFATASTDLRQALSPGVAEPPEPVAGGAFYVPMTPRVPSGERGAEEEKVRQKYLDSLAHLGRADERWRSAFDSSASAGTGRGDRSRQFRPSDFVPSERFAGLQAGTVCWLRRHASAILDGVVGVQPIRYGANRSACEHCSFRAFCRFDLLRGEYRSMAVGAGADRGSSA
jgi:ATP-dependent helicase/DNAse subunit B